MTVPIRYCTCPAPRNQHQGDSYAALAETINAVQNRADQARGPWRTLDHVEYATAEWVDWFNHQRLYESCGDIPPAELETAYYAQQRAQHELSSQTVRGHEKVPTVGQVRSPLVAK